MRLLSAGLYLVWSSTNKELSISPYYAAEPPVITVPPESTVVSAEATPNIVYFQCTAVGSQTPIISWKHLGEEATSRAKYIVTTAERFSTPKGERGITSTLTLLDIRAQDTGMVECEADAPPSVETNNQQLPGDSASAPLTVLGKRRAAGARRSRGRVLGVRTPSFWRIFFVFLMQISQFKWLSF